MYCDIWMLPVLVTVQASSTISMVLVYDPLYRDKVSLLLWYFAGNTISV